MFNLSLTDYLDLIFILWEIWAWRNRSHWHHEESTKRVQKVEHTARHLPWSLEKICHDENMKAPALTGVAQSVGRHPAKQKINNWIPSQGTCLGCGFGPPVRERTRGNWLMFLYLSFSLSSPLSKNKNT